MSDPQNPQKRRVQPRKRAVKHDNFVTNHPVASTFLFGTTCLAVVGGAFLVTRYHVCKLFILFFSGSVTKVFFLEFLQNRAWALPHDARKFAGWQFGFP